jgi:hypothetical protein
MDSMMLTKARVVDLLRYREGRAQPRLDFQERPKPRLTLIQPFRPLTPREIAHRERMVRELGKGQRSEVKGQR